MQQTRFSLRATLIVGGFTALFAAGTATGVAQVKLSYSGASGQTSAGSAVASSAFGGTSIRQLPTFRPGRYGPYGRSQFYEGTGNFRPYPLVPRPAYRLEVGQQPIRRTTFSLGYVSYGGYGSYFY